MNTEETTPVPNVIDRYEDEKPCDSRSWSCNNPEHLGTVEWLDKPTCTRPEDDGTMTENVQELRNVVVGRKIVKAEKRALTDDEKNTLKDGGRYYWGASDALILELDSGHQVVVRDTSDCCAYTALDKFLYDPAGVDHMILGVGTEDGFDTWDEIREDDKACYRDAARHLLATISGGALEAIAPGAAAAAEAGRKAAQRAAEKVSIAQAGLDAAHAGQEAGMELGAAIGPQSPKWLRDIDQYAKQTALESINLALGPDVVAVQLPEPVGVNSADNRVWSHEPHYIEQEFNGDIVIDDRLGIDAADLATVGAILIAAKAKAEASE